MPATAEDRLAFVIETEAHLDGIRSARSEVRGIGTDSQVAAQKMSSASQSQAQSVAQIANMSAKTRASFEAMDAEGKKAAMSLLGVSKAEQQAVISAAEHAKAVQADTEALKQQAGAAEQSAVSLLRARDAARAAIAANIPRSPIAFAAAANAAANPMLGPVLPPGGIIPAAQALERTDAALKKIPGGARTAANAFSMLSSAALTGDGSMRGLTMAAGSLSTGLAHLSKSAAVAAAASGIGALVVVAGIAAQAIYHMGRAAETGKQQLDNLKNFTAANILTNLAGIRAARDAAIASAAEASDAGFFARLRKTMGADLATPEGRGVAAGLGADFHAADRANKLNEEASKVALEKLRTERLRVLALADQARAQIEVNRLEIIGQQATAGSLDTFAKRRQETITQAAIEDARIKKQFEWRDESGKIIRTNQAAMNEEIAQHRVLTEIQLAEISQAEQLANLAYRRAAATAQAAGGNVTERYQDRLAQIQAEADAEVAAGRSIVDVEAMKQAKIRALRSTTSKQAMDDARSLTSVLIDSGSKQVRAVGHAAETIRRVIIGAQAAHAAVESAIEGGKAIGSLASMDFRGAALHGAAALELAKAAALGAQESLGGGRGASGGGAGAGSGGGGNTFEPRSGTEGQGMVTINLLSQNPYGAEQIQQISYLLQRGEILKRPIPIGPTNGLKAVA